MKKFILILLILLLSLSIYCQQVSTLKAMLFSAVVPGLGELYTKNYTKTGIFFSSELAIIATYFRLKAESEWADNNLQQFAFENAGVPKNSTDAHYLLIKNYVSSDDLNEYIDRSARNYYLIYKSDPEGYYEYLEENLITEEEDMWSWDTDENWKHFGRLRIDKQNFETYTQFAIAAGILNRLISIIDSAISAKRFNKKVGLFGNISVKPDWKNKGFLLNYEYRF
ncbi:MAG TPA: hypothetical protein ENL20_01510 [Candidatus Cloacimonetes bacterium]|nr:hypothetical protein [Candidatus Cloacimonadota bacterium]